MFFYVDTREMRKAPKEGVQFVAWYVKGSMTRPEGYPHIDVINGEEVQIRSMSFEKLEAFLKLAFKNQPWIKPRQVIEEEVDH